MPRAGQKHNALRRAIKRSLQERTGSGYQPKDTALANAYRQFKQENPDEHKAYKQQKRRLKTTLG
jgi:hypothetical protein